MKIDKLEVFYHDRIVGTLAMTAAKKVAFEYHAEWLRTGFSISPFSLPLKKQVFVPEKTYFGGLFGVFADSLPDAWGNLLLTRLMKEKGMDLANITMLERLAIVGNSGMGALTYKPVIELTRQQELKNLDYLAEECGKILNTEYSQELDGLYRLGGTSGGARPKIMTVIDEQPWIIKFSAKVDSVDIGKMEYEYSQCAKECGILMSDTKLFPSKKCKGYFGTRRFDIEDGNRIHMLTVAALLELDFEQPSLDYSALMKLTKILTNDNTLELENMYRRMCFNVFAHNRDDHSKNFSYLYNEEKDQWSLSPAYDLTYSNTYFGEHTTSVAGNGKNPGMKELVEVGVGAGLKKKWCETVAEEISHTVREMLGQYLY